MKKVVFSLLIVMVLFLSISVFVACGEDSGEKVDVTVKFMVGDTVVSEGTYKTGEYVQDPQMDEYLNYTISHWTVNGNRKNAIFPYQVGTADITFYAYTTQWINVAFYVDGANYENWDYESDELVYAPDVNPTKDGYLFRYWALDGKVVKFPYDLSDVDDTTTQIKFQAVFELQSVVTFESDGEVVNTYIYGEGDKLQLAPAPEKSGYTFIYWQDEEGNRAEGGSVVTKDATYTALFEKNLYTINYYIGNSSTPYKTLYSSGKVLELEYTGSGNFYGWYTSSAFKTKYNFNKTVSKNVNIYGKVVTSNYSILQNLNNTKIDVDTTNFKSTYKFNATYPTSISLNVSNATVSFTYKFTTTNYKDVSISYDMMAGTINGAFGSDEAKVAVTVPKYNYYELSYTSYTYTELVYGAYYNEYLKELGLHLAKLVGEYVQDYYDNYTGGTIVTGGVADPDKTYTVRVNTSNKTINVNAAEEFYSVKVQNSDGDYIYYDTNIKSASISNLSSGIYKVIVVYETNYTTYVLRQILTYSIQVS